MNQALYKLWLWFWHLLPANPILVRVVQGGSRRQRHMMLRFGYLAILFCVVTISLVNASGGDTLADLAKGASRTFEMASITQLALMCFLAPVFTAGAITQEKDSRTYNILLTTPLSNAQIILGSLMSRLFFVIMLLVAGLPIFFTTMIYGGVTSRQIIASLAIAGSTAILTGSLAISVSMIKVGTRRTIFSFFLMIAIYLLSIYALGRWDRTWVEEAPVNVDGRRLSWLAPYHPFLCLEVALNQIKAPDIGLVQHYGPLDKYLLSNPSGSYVFLTVTIALALVLVSMFFVRSSDKEGEIGIGARLKAFVTRQEVGERRRRLRHVWQNPVAWREAATRASAVSRGLTRTLIIGGGAVAAIWLLVAYLTHAPGGTFDLATTRQWLAVIIAIEFGLVLLIATQTAATAITKERESNTMDLLTTTPLTSGYIMWGKLRGLVSFVVPLIAVPTASLLLFGVSDLIRGKSPPVVAIETGVELAALMLMFTAVACVIGLQFSLKQKKTVRAVMGSVGVLVFSLLLATALFSAIASSAGWFGSVIAPATPFTAIWFTIDPARLFNGDASQLTPEAMGTIRVGVLVGSGVCLLIYYGIVKAFYSSMVKSFDMTIRKQSAQ